jgi:chromosome segregation ATPase
MSEDKINEIANAVARIETKLDAHKERLDDSASRIHTLERKFWTALGAFFLSIATYIKSLFG